MVVAPAGTETVEPTVADVEFEDRFTVNPPEGAAAEIVTVPVLGYPAKTVLGLSESDLTVCADPRAGTSKASSKKINCNGHRKVRRDFEICSVCGIDVPQTRIRVSRVCSSLIVDP